MVALLAGACKGREPAQPAAKAPPVLMAPDVRLVEAGGRVLDLKNERGNVVLLFFGYTHCPDVCPTTLADFSSLKHRLGPRADRIRFVFVSVDPRRDSPQRTADYAHTFDRSFYGVTADSVTLARIQRGFRTASYVEKDSTGEYSVAHSASVFIIAPDGRVSQMLRIGGSGVEQLAPLVDEALHLPVPAKLTVAEPWVRAQGDLHTPAAGYLTFQNPGPLPTVVRGVQCDGAERVTIHETMTMNNGVMVMRPIDSLIVPGNSTLALAPGGMHLMLAGLSRPLNAGERVECTVETSAGEVRVVVPVRAS